MGGGSGRSQVTVPACCCDLSPVTESPRDRCGRGRCWPPSGTEPRPPLPRSGMEARPLRSGIERRPFSGAGQPATGRLLELCSSSGSHSGSLSFPLASGRRATAAPRRARRLGPATPAASARGPVRGGGGGRRPPPAGLRPRSLGRRARPRDVEPKDRDLESEEEGIGGIDHRTGTRPVGAEVRPSRDVPRCAVRGGTQMRQ